MIKLLKVLSKLENIKIPELENSYDLIPEDAAIKDKTINLKAVLGKSYNHLSEELLN